MSRRRGVMARKKNSRIGSDVMEDLKERLKSKSFKEKFEKQRLKVAVGQMVRRIAKEKKLSIRDLASRMDSSVSQVQRLFEDKNVSVSTLTKFAAATGKK